MARLLARQRPSMSSSSMALMAKFREQMALSKSMNTSIAGDAVMICCVWYCREAFSVMLLLRSSSAPDVVFALFGLGKDLRRYWRWKLVRASKLWRMDSRIRFMVINAVSMAINRSMSD